LRRISGKQAGKSVNSTHALKLDETTTAKKHFTAAEISTRLLAGIRHGAHRPGFVAIDDLPAVGPPEG
ncbi:MAG: hypothetical protein AB8I56_13020, partial [Anaerolineales bacterium]